MASNQARSDPDNHVFTWEWNTREKMNGEYRIHFAANLTSRKLSPLCMKWKRKTRKNHKLRALISRVIFIVRITTKVHDFKTISIFVFIFIIYNTPLPTTTDVWASRVSRVYCTLQTRKWTLCFLVANAFAAKCFFNGLTRFTKSVHDLCRRKRRCFGRT